MMNNRDKGMKFAVITALVIGVMGVAVGFAAFSTALQIDGSATVNTSSWNVFFASATKDGTSTATVLTEPTITTNDAGKALAKLNNWQVTFNEPGQFAKYNIKVTNSGSYEAILDNVNIPKNLTCTGTGDTKATDETNVCGNLEYTLTYATAQTHSDSTSSAVITEGDKLAAGQSVDLVLTLTYKSFNDETKLPKAAVNVSGLATSLNYTQGALANQ